MKRATLFLLAFLTISLVVFAQNPKQKDSKATTAKRSLYKSCKPYTRWWWFAGIIKNEDIRDQLNWLKANNFGGVEVAFIYPVKRDPKAIRYPWLGDEWQKAVTYTKMYADSIGLGCDFTFGTLWPFGGTFVSDADRTQIWNKPDFKQPLRLSWTHPDTGNVLNHLDRAAFNRYATVMGKALAPALKGTKSAIFCDSWEVETKHLWTAGFDTVFLKQFGYDIRPFMDSIYAPYNAGPRYDYMKLVSERVVREFYIPFTNKAHELGSVSRVQCSGAPVDLITAYASVDVPETEAMLYEPGFTRIVSSAAALSGKKVISSETFTCLYGWPAKHFRKEQTADLKLVCDALFANGVNQIFWHGMPYNPTGVDTNYFYATVHVGRNGSLTKELAAFNTYMTRVSEKMRLGKPYTDIAVYLPLEDSWIAGEYPKELQLPWSWGAYELRYERFNPELKGYQPTWINRDFLSQATVENKVLKVNHLSFKVLYVDAKSLDVATLSVMLKLAGQGLPVCLKQNPVQSGHIPDKNFEAMLKKLRAYPNVSADFRMPSGQLPLVTGKDIPGFYCRNNGKTATIFFANPLTEKLTYPVVYGQSYQDSTITRTITLNYKGKTYPVKLEFKPYQSLFLRITEKGEVKFKDIYFMPAVAVKE